MKLLFRFKFSQESCFHNSFVQNQILEFDDSLLELANEQLEILNNAKYKRYI